MLGLLLVGIGIDSSAQTADPAVLRTPDERFAALVDYPFAPNYVDVEPYGIRMHYIDEGPRDGRLVLVLHGNPNWSFGVRELVTALSARGFRVIAPDMIGFGRSDKPADRALHTYDNQEAWMRSFVERLDLRDVHLNVQDWGGLLGLRLAVRMPERILSVSASNTDLPTGEHVSAAFLTWQRTSQTTPLWSNVIESATATTLTASERAAFDAPYPDESYKAGPRQLPLAVPTSPDHPDGVENRQLLEDWARWTKPFLTIFSEVDNISPDADRRLQALIPGAAGQPHRRVADTGHFIREDVPGPYADWLTAFIDTVQPAIDADQFDLSGGWFEPETSGQGLMIDIQDSGARGAGSSPYFFAGWFTYTDTVGGVEQQAWYTLEGVGEPGRRGFDLEILRPTTGQFESGAPVAPQRLGVASIVFSSCTQATLDYAFDASAGGRSGQVRLQRLLPNVSCEAGTRTANAPQSFLSTGGWYVPGMDGQGLLFEFNPTQPTLFGAWFTYAPAGATPGLRWYSLQAPSVTVSQTRFDAVPIYANTGGRFDTPGAPTLAPVGSADLELSGDCRQITLSYRFSAGELAGRSGTQRLQRLGPVPVECVSP